jgi:predicted RNase H-like nuclease (RuvC/YqgF family)
VTAADTIVAMGGGGLVAVIVKGLFDYFRPKHERDKSKAEGDARLIDATANIFTATVEDLRGEIKDLRERLNRVENEVIELRRERDHLIRENEDMRGKLDIAHGEIRQLQQVLQSRARYNQDGVVDAALPEPETEE